MAKFAIIRMQKFQISDVQGIQKHNQRQGISKSNPDIDYKKSHKNYDILNDENIKYESEIKEQISERVKRKPRANSVVLSEFIVTASPEYMKTLSGEEQKKYFEKSLEFIEERYENILYAVVHHDEATPHMHVGLIPITEDNRLSAKDIFNRQELRELQEEFPKHLQEKKFEVVRGKKDSEKKHLSSQAYKEKQDLDREVLLKREELKKIEQKEKNAIEEQKRIVEQTKIKFEEIQAVEVNPSHAEKVVETKEHIGKSFFGREKVIEEQVERETGNVVMTPERFAEIKEYINTAKALKGEYERLGGSLESEQNSRSVERSEYENRIEELEETIEVRVEDLVDDKHKEIQKENELMRANLGKARTVFERRIEKHNAQVTKELTGMQKIGDEQSGEIRELKQENTALKDEKNTLKERNEGLLIQNAGLKVQVDWLKREIKHLYETTRDYIKDTAFHFRDDFDAFKNMLGEKLVENHNAEQKGKENSAELENDEESRKLMVLGTEFSEAENDDISKKRVRMRERDDGMSL